MVDQRKRGAKAGTASKAQKAASEKVRKKETLTKTEETRRLSLMKKGDNKTRAEKTELGRLSRKNWRSGSSATAKKAAKASSAVKTKQTTARKKATQKARKATTARRKKK